MVLPFAFALVLIGAGIAWSGAVRHDVRLQRRTMRPSMLERLDAYLEAHDVPLSGAEFLRTGLIVGMVLAVLLTVLLGPTILTFVAVPLGVLAYWSYLGAQAEKFELEYLQALVAMVSSLQRAYAASPNLRAALMEIIPYIPAVVQEDLKQIVAAINTGTPLQEALEAWVERRRGNPYVGQIVEALTLRESHGGSLKAVLDGLDELMRGLLDIRREIEAKQSAPRTEGLIVALAPFFFLIGVKLMADYEGGFYHTLAGQAVLAAVLVLSSASWWLSRRIAASGMRITAWEVE